MAGFMDVYEFNMRAYGASRCGQTDARLAVVRPWVGSNRDVLDLGCLDGTIGELFVRQGNRVTGIDASRNALEKARSRGLDARLGNLDEPLALPDASFDVVFAGEIIEHVMNADAFAGEVYRVLRPGGTFVVTTPNLAALGRRLLLLANRNPHIEVSFEDPEAAGHVRYFVSGTLAEFLRRHGFEIRALASDVVNFNAAGSVRSRLLARWFPTLGRTLIVNTVKPAGKPCQ